jgi:hypothetical protein
MIANTSPEVESMARLKMICRVIENRVSSESFLRRLLSPDSSLAEAELPRKQARWVVERASRRSHRRFTRPGVKPVD